jgi:hypothetical protein
VKHLSENIEDPKALLAPGIRVLQQTEKEGLMRKNGKKEIKF